MAFRPSSFSSDIAGARSDERNAVHAPPIPTSGGAAVAAKESAHRWQQSGAASPQDSPAPWFQPTAQLFTAHRNAYPNAIKAWKDRFLNETDSGWKFAPPPPEPAASGGSTAGGSTAGGSTAGGSGSGGSTSGGSTSGGSTSGGSTSGGSGSGGSTSGGSGSPGAKGGS